LIDRCCRIPIYLLVFDCRASRLSRECRPPSD
jgi:hypothetical protein